MNITYILHTQKCLCCLHFRQEGVVPNKSNPLAHQQALDGATQQAGGSWITSRRSWELAPFLAIKSAQAFPSRKMWWRVQPHRIIHGLKGLRNVISKRSYTFATSSVRRRSHGSLKNLCVSRTPNGRSINRQGT